MAKLCPFRMAASEKGTAVSEVSIRCYGSKCELWQGTKCCLKSIQDHLATLAHRAEFPTK